MKKSIAYVLHDIAHVFDDIVGENGGVWEWWSGDDGVDGMGRTVLLGSGMSVWVSFTCGFFRRLEMYSCEGGRRGDCCWSGGGWCLLKWQ